MYIISHCLIKRRLTTHDHEHQYKSRVEIEDPEFNLDMPSKPQVTNVVNASKNEKATDVC